MITEINKKTAAALQEAMEKAMAEVAEEFGVKITQYGGQLKGSAEAVLKFHVAVTDQGAVEKQQEREFNLYARSFGLESKHRGTIVTSRGEKWRLIGIAPSRTKYPLKFESVDTGKVLLFTEDLVEKVKAAYEAKAAA